MTAVPAAERGRTHIEPRVVVKIARVAATEIDGVSGVAGITGTARRPRVDATVDGGIAVVKVALSVEYPRPLRTVTEAVRGIVVERVGGLAGVDVRQVDIEVAGLHARPEPARAVR